MIRVLLLAWLSGCTLLAQADWKTYSPKEMTSMEVHLVSMGPSHDLFTSGGHTLLRIIDPVAHTDLMYNWGAFSEDEPLFLWSFMRGTSEYHLLVEPMFPAFQKDIQAYPRNVFQDRITLTVLQKKKLLQLIENWLQHPRYQYHVWSKNCSTLVAELLNEATDGGIAAQLEGKKVSVTYRSLWMTYFGSFTALAVAADFVLNGKADKPLTGWGLRFTPMLFRQYLHPLFAIDDAGVLSSEHLLTHPVQLYKHPVPYGVGERGYQAILLFVALLAFLGMMSKRLCYDKLARAILCLTQNLWGIFAFLVSMTVFAITFLSTREYFQFSAVLWIFWPVDLLFIGRKFSTRWIRLQNGLVVLHVISWLGLGLCYGVGFVEQSMLHIGLYLIPASGFVFLLRAYLASSDATALGLKSSTSLR